MSELNQFVGHSILVWRIGELVVDAEKHCRVCVCLYVYTYIHTYIYTYKIILEKYLGIIFEHPFSIVSMIDKFP